MREALNQKQRLREEGAEGEIKGTSLLVDAESAIYMNATYRVLDAPSKAHGRCLPATREGSFHSDIVIVTVRESGETLHP